jgi:hypothetical protein
MIPEATTSQTAQPNSPLYQNILLTDVGGEESTLEWAEVGSAEFRESLVQTLDRAKFLSSDPNAPFQLKAFIIEVRRPTAAFTVSVNSFVRYTLLRSKDRGVIFDDVLQATRTATLGDEFIGIERMRIAVEGAMQANISTLLERLRRTVVP